MLTQTDFAYCFLVLVQHIATGIGFAVMIHKWQVRLFSTTAVTPRTNPHTHSEESMHDRLKAVEKLSELLLRPLTVE